MSTETATRFAVRPLVGRGPDGSTLYAVIDTTLTEPDSILDYFSDHPRLAGKFAKLMAEDTVRRLNHGSLDPEDI